jgi:hypothetical protein
MFLCVLAGCPPVIETNRITAPMVLRGQTDPAFQALLDEVDAARAAQDQARYDRAKAAVWAAWGK